MDEESRAEGAARVEMWVIDLDAPELEARYSSALIDEEERRSAQERRGNAARRYVAAHAALRTILAGRLEVDPVSIVYERACGSCGALDHGRPKVAGAPRLAFSLAHSGARAVVVVGDDLRLGADVERVRARPFLGRLAARVMGDEEHAAWSLSSGDTALVRFLEAWTAKEAYLKATGEGISRPLREVPATGPVGWVVVHADVGHGYVAAVAVQAAALTLTRSYWSRS